MPASCPNCGGKWPFGAILCTACGFDPEVHPDPKAVARTAASAPRGRYDWLRSGWFLAVIPNLIILPLAAFMPTEHGRSRDLYETFMLGVFIFMGCGVFLAAAISAYLRTRDTDHSFFRPRFFRGAIVYSDLRFKLAIMGYLLAVLIAIWMMKPGPRLD